MKQKKDKTSIGVDAIVIILNEDFHDFSIHCDYREMISQTGNTGWWKCTNILKIKPCSLDICPRVKTK